MSRRGSDPHEDGVIAVVVAVCAVVLLGMAALAVDLGNVWSQRREVQVQADLAVLAAGSALPARDATACRNAAAVALESLRRNASYSQDDGAAAQWTIDELLNPDAGSGYAHCPTRNSISIVSPPSHVDYGFATLFGTSGRDVDATARAEIRTPGRVMPFMLKASCSNGRQTIGGSGTVDTPLPPYVVPSGQQGTHTVSRMTPTTFVETTTPPSMSFRVSGWPGDATVPPDFSADRVVFTRGTAVAAFLDIVPTPPTGGTVRNYTFPVPAAVASVPGDYEVWMWSGKQQKFSVRYGTKLQVTDAPISGTCSKDSGNEYWIDSPRKDSSGNSHTLRTLNLALGLDHGLAVFEPTSARPADGICASGGSGSNPIPYAVVDNDPNRDEANCIKTETGGSNVGLEQGMVTGGTYSGGAYSGLLYKEPTSADCSANGPMTYLGRPGANNDTLSCFTPSGTTRRQIIQGTAGPVLDPDIYLSPRFLWMPIIADENLNGTKFEAISGFAPAFITDEGRNGASATNGVNIQGSRVDGITVIGFSAVSLPDATSGPGPTSPYVGIGPKLVRLVD